MTYTLAELEHAFSRHCECGLRQPFHLFLAAYYRDHSHE